MQEQKWHLHGMPPSMMNDVDNIIPWSIQPSLGSHSPLLSLHGPSHEHLNSDTQSSVKRKHHGTTCRYDLVSAMNKKHIRLNACPIVDIHHYKLEIIELQLYWLPPQYGLIEQSKIQDLANRSGLLDKIAIYSLTLAIEFLLNHRPLYNSIGISLNLNLEQLSSRSLVNQLITQIQDSGLRPNQFIFQFNETATSFTSLSEISVCLNQIRCQGIKVVIDAFGSGFSTLDFLNNLAVDAIKLDSSLVAEIDSNPRKLETLVALVQLCRRLQIRVTITGVDTALIQRILLHNGIAEVLVQGLFYTPAIELSLFHSLLANESGITLNYLAFSPEHIS